MEANRRGLLKTSPRPSIFHLGVLLRLLFGNYLLGIEGSNLFLQIQILSFPAGTLIPKNLFLAFIPEIEINLLLQYNNCDSTAFCIYSTNTFTVFYYNSILCKKLSNNICSLFRKCIIILCRAFNGGATSN